MAESKKLRVPVNRLLIGLSAAICLGTAVAIWVTDPYANPLGNAWSGLLGALIRVGFVLGALWLVVPARTKLNVPLNVFLVAVVVLVGIALKPRIAIPMFALLVVAAIVLRPRDKAAKQKWLARLYRQTQKEKDPRDV